MGNQSNIEINVTNDNVNLNDVVISGMFKVKSDEVSITDTDEKILKHIILVVMRSASYQAVSPFSDTVVFKDDVTIDANGVSGDFKIYLKDHIKFDGAGDYYVLCSLGTTLSNTEKALVMS